MDSFELWHQFFRAVDIGLTDPLYCADGGILYLRAGKDFEPRLHCYHCNTNFIPGYDFIQKAKRQLEEAYEL